MTVLGAGSVGSHLVYSLGPAGLAINVIDAGTVRPRHAQGGRTAYDPTQVGIKKVSALKQKVERAFPGTVVNSLPYNTAEVPDAVFRALFAKSLVVILAIDDPQQIVRISDLAYPITELIQPVMHAKGESGHIALSIPFVTPCLRCILGINDATDIRRLDSEPAAGLDIAAVAQQAARIALDIAYSKVTGRPITRWDPTKNLIFITNTKQEMSPEGPGIHFEGSRTRPGCPTCDNHTAA
jgi:molybdopterin/thiamine biosynthesis adenylyltransferase